MLKEIRAELDPDDETSLQDDIHEDALGLAAWWVEVYHTLQAQHHVSDRVQQLFWQLVCRPCVNFVYRGRQSQDKRPQGLDTRTSPSCEAETRRMEQLS